VLTSSFWGSYDAILGGPGKAIRERDDETPSILDLEWSRIRPVQARADKIR